jgi:hypothetical protein
MRFRPRDLASRAAIPPLECVLGVNSVTKPASQRQLVSIVHHEGWLLAYEAAHSMDSQPEIAAVSDRRDRETTRLVATSQPFSSAWLSMPPATTQSRIRSAEFRWSLQRRLGLYVTAPMAVFGQLSAVGVHYDPLGDRITNERETDRSAPHNAGLRTLYDATQASATHAVVLGDKEQPETTEAFNSGCVVDLGETLMGRGGGDLCVEFKAYGDLVPAGASSEYETTHRGNTHAFGNTEERLIRMVTGVRARGSPDDSAWDPQLGTGRVAEHRGSYDDALRTKRNTVVLFLVSLFGGLAPHAVRHLHTLKERATATDRTEYPRRADEGHYLEHWAQRLVASVVTADARRCLKRLDALRSTAQRALSRARALRPSAPPQPALLVSSGDAAH